MLWKILLHPSRCPARFGQKSSGNEAVGWGDLPENNVLSQDMVTTKQIKTCMLIETHSVELKVKSILCRITFYLFKNCLTARARESDLILILSIIILMPFTGLGLVYSNE